MLPCPRPAVLGSRPLRPRGPREQAESPPVPRAVAPSRTVTLVNALGTALGASCPSPPPCGDSPSWQASRAAPGAGGAAPGAGVCEKAAAGHPWWACLPRASSPLLSREVVRAYRGAAPWSDYGPLVSSSRLHSPGVGTAREQVGWSKGGRLAAAGPLRPGLRAGGRGRGGGRPACDQLPAFTSPSPEGPPALGWRAGCIRGLWMGGPPSAAPPAPVQGGAQGRRRSSAGHAPAPAPHASLESWSPVDSRALPG